MNRIYLPPLLRGIGMTLILLATLVGVIVARGDIRQDQMTRMAIYTKAETDAKAQPGAAGDLAELKAEVDDLRSEVEEQSVTEEVIKNPWFDWVGFLGTATIVGSFYVESFLRRH